MLGLFVVTAFVAGAALRDFEQRSDMLFFTKPVSEELSCIRVRFGLVFGFDALNGDNGHGAPNTSLSGTNGGAGSEYPKTTTETASLQPWMRSNLL